jgi:hypothetical protein
MRRPTLGPSPTLGLVPGPALLQLPPLLRAGLGRVCATRVG